MVGVLFGFANSLCHPNHGNSMLESCQKLLRGPRSCSVCLTSFFRAYRDTNTSLKQAELLSLTMATITERWSPSLTLLTRTVCSSTPRTSQEWFYHWKDCLWPEWRSLSSVVPALALSSRPLKLLVSPTNGQRCQLPRSSPRERLVLTSPISNASRLWLLVKRDPSPSKRRLRLSPRRSERILIAPGFHEST